MEFKAKRFDYNIISQVSSPSSDPYPLLRDDKGDESFFNVSPLHGRSYIVGKNKDDHYVVEKGNGLSYTCYPFLNTEEIGNDSLGVLLKEDAIRDFLIGNEINRLGIKTNKMEYVIEITNHPIKMPISNDVINPVLLQYTVECPYRIEDAAFMPKTLLQNEVSKWQKYNKKNFKYNYLIAADVLIQNLRILHDNNILHNALTPHNHTWALELLDFEIAHTPSYPYSEEDDRRHVKDLFAREIIDIYKVINYIANILEESVSFNEIDKLFDTYDFNLSKYKI